jgi:hypothetical protein
MWWPISAMETNVAIVMLIVIVLAIAIVVCVKYLIDY